MLDFSFPLLLKSEGCTCNWKNDSVCCLLHCDVSLKAAPTVSFHVSQILNINTNYALHRSSFAFADVADFRATSHNFVSIFFVIFAVQCSSVWCCVFFVSRWCSGTYVKRESMCSLRKSSYLLCETWLRSSSSQVKRKVAEMSADLENHLRLCLILYLTFTIIISVRSRWASHLRSPFIRHAEKRFVGSAEAGGCDKVEGVSNKISPCKSVWF